MQFILLSSLFTFVLFAQLCAAPIAGVFAPRDNPVFALGVPLLPAVWGMDGAWLATPVAEGIGALVSAGFLYAKRHVYGYVRSAKGGEKARRPQSTRFIE